MSIQLFNKINKKSISLILAGGLLFSPLQVNAGLISFVDNGKKGLQNIEKIKQKVNDYEKNKLLDTLGISSFFKKNFGVSLNLKCLSYSAKIKEKIYFPCKMKKSFSLKIGPCKVTAGLSKNPIFSRLNDLCSAVNKGVSIYGAVNIGLTSMTAAAGLSKDSNLTKILFFNPKSNNKEGLSYQDLYGKKDGNSTGFLATEAKKHPNSSDAKAFLNSDKELLILKDLTLKQQASSRLSTMKLPENISQYEITVNKNAKIYKDTIPDIIDIISASQNILSTKCIDAAKVSPPEHSEYNYTNYLGCFVAYAEGKNQEGEVIYEDTGTVIEKDLGENGIGTIPKLYKTIDNAINFEYANKLMILKAKSKYFEYAPTESKFKLLPVRDKKNFLYRSVIWSAQETNLLGQREKERKKAHLKVKIAMRKAYIASMPFDDKAANYELNQLLQ